MNTDGIDNSTFPRVNGDPPNPVDAERSQRLYAKRMGVIICFLLIFMDGGAPRQDNRYLHKEETVPEHNTQSQSSYISKLNGVVSSTRNLDAQVYYARNITGIYHGLWEVDGVRGESNITETFFAKKSAKALTMQLRSTKLRNVPDLDFVYGVARVYGAGFSGSDLFYPLQGVFLAATGELHLLSSIQASEMLFLQLPDSKPNLQDTNDNATKSSTEQQLNKQLNPGHLIAAPGGRNNNRTIVKGGMGNRTSRNNKSFDGEDSYISNRQRKRRHPRLLSNYDPYTEIDVRSYKLSRDAHVTDVELPTWKKHPQVFDGGWETNMNSEKKVTRNERRALSTVPVTSAFFVQPLSTGKLLEDNRIVGDPGTPTSTPVLAPKRIQSLAVGTTGMFIHLINLNQLPALMRENNSTSPTSELRRAIPDMNPNLIQAIGESSLPPTFKSLQRSSAVERFDPGVLGIAFGLGTGTSGIAQSCQFSIKLKEPATVVDLGDEVKVKESSAAILAARSNAAYATTMSGVFESIDCGVHFNVSATSFRVELAEVERKAANYSWLASAVCFLQIALLTAQLGYSRTQAASTKISILCICAQSMLDAALCIGHLLLCAALPQVFFSHFMWVTILKLLLFGVFEMRTVIIVCQARYSQEVAGEGAMQGLRNRLAKVHLRFYAALFAAISISFYTRHKPIVTVFLFYSYWVPQIVWNIVCGTRRTFHVTYSVGTTLTRLFIPLYLLGCPKNFFTILLPGAIPYSPASCITLVIWSLLQMSVILAQDCFGPRFFLPANMFPRAYDYFRPVPAHVLRGSHSASTTHSVMHSSNADVETGGLIECVICYNAIDTTTQDYMITPCDHLFHKACLEQWLTMKMECCICRAALPSLVES